VRADAAAWLRRNHPELASRWSEPGRGSQMFRPSPQSASEESQRPGVARLPRPGGGKRDFGPLTPSAAARHAYSGPASEKDSMSEGEGVQAHGPSRPGKMKLFSGKPTGFALRDTNAAGRR